MADPAKAFVSYSRADTEFVLRLCQDLRAAGASIWLDQLDIHPGEDWDEAIERGLFECGRMLAVLSPKSVASQNVLDEIGYALSKKKPIIPVLHQDCEVPYRLNRIQYVDFRTAYDEPLKHLLSAIGDAKQAPQSIPVPMDHVRFRRWYLLGGAGAAVIAGLLVAGLAVFFQRTRIGRALRAVADDHAAAQSVGIPLNQIWFIVWLVAGLVALVAGAVWGAKLGVQFSLSLLALKALPVLILGGFTSVPGAIIGGLVIGAGEKISEVFLGPSLGGGIEIWFAYVLALLFLLVRPQGMFGERIIERV